MSLFPPYLAGRQLVSLEPLLPVEFQERAMQDALAVLAPRVQANGPTELRDAARLVDVAMERDQRLITIDHSANGLGSGGSHQHRAALNHRRKVRAHHGRRVDRGTDGRHVEVKD